MDKVSNAWKRLYETYEESDTREESDFLYALLEALKGNTQIQQSREFGVLFDELKWKRKTAEKIANAGYYFCYIGKKTQILFLKTVVEINIKLTRISSTFSVWEQQNI